MKIWSIEIKELENLNESLKGQLPELGKELKQLISTEDENVVLLYSRRCLEVIVTDLCEYELKRPRKTEPLKGIIDKLNSEGKVPSNIATSMHGLNSLSTYGTHPKDFDPEQVKPALSNLAIVIKWYIRYIGTRDISVITEDNTKAQKTQGFEKREGALKQSMKLPKVLIISILIIVVIAITTTIYFVTRQTRNNASLEKSIAVLPFRNDSHDDSTQYFMDGVMEELLTNLQKIKELRVLGRTSVEQYRNHTKTIPEVAKELGVNFIVEGSGQKSGNSLRMRVQLIMAKKERHLWANSFEQDTLNLKDYFKNQSQFANAIAAELDAALTPQEKQLIDKIPTSNIEAYEAYLKGMIYWRKLTQIDLGTAMKYFQLALDKDPNYALAYTGIGLVWGGLAQAGYASPTEALPKMNTAFITASKLDSTLDQVHYTLAVYKTWAEWDWKSGESEFQKTLEINPNHAEAHAYYSHLLNITGRPEESMKQMQLALKLDPLNALIKSLYGIDLLFIRRYDDAITAMREALIMDPTAPVALAGLVYSLHLTGKYDEALEIWKSLYCNLYKNNAHAFDQGYKKEGYIGALIFEADTLAAQYKTIYVNPTDIANLYALAGKKELALDWLEQAFEIHDPNLPYLLWPLYDDIRNETRFQDLCHKMNLPYK
jgi:adenylate cyclase